MHAALSRVSIAGITVLADAMISVHVGQVMGLHGAELRDHVADLRTHFWGERADHSLMPVAMREICKILKADIRDMERQSSTAREQGGRSAASGGPSPPQEAGGEGTGGPTSAAAPSATAGGADMEPCSVGQDMEPAESEQRPEIDRSGMTGGQFYVMYQGSSPDMHPWCAAAVLACASHAWLLPEYLQSLVSELETAMLETETVFESELWNAGGSSRPNYSR